MAHLSGEINSKSQSWTYDHVVKWNVLLKTLSVAENRNSLQVAQVNGVCYVDAMSSMVLEKLGECQILKWFLPGFFQFCSIFSTAVCLPVHPTLTPSPSSARVSCLWAAWSPTPTILHTAFQFGKSSLTGSSLCATWFKHLRERI